jgi:hypothetical protein
MKKIKIKKIKKNKKKTHWWVRRYPSFSSSFKADKM